MKTTHIQPSLRLSRRIWLSTQSHSNNKVMFKMQSSKTHALMAIAISLFAALPALAEPDSLATLARTVEPAQEPAHVVKAAIAPADTREAPARSEAGKSDLGHRDVGKPLTAAPGAKDRYHALIASHAAANGVPVRLADAVVRIESRYNPRVSHGGALGLMQIKPQTARGVGFSGSASELYQPETNIRYGMKYLGQAYRMANGDTCGTVMRYQSGHRATHMSGANRAYCAKARAIIARG